MSYTSEKSHVGMTRCFLCHDYDSILLDRRLRNSLPHDCGVIHTVPCAACQSKIDAGFVGLVLTTEAAVAKVQEDGRVYLNHTIRSGLTKADPFVPDFSPRSFGIFVKKEVILSTLDDSENSPQITKMANTKGWIVMLGDVFAMMGGLNLTPPDVTEALYAHGIVSRDYAPATMTASDTV